MNTPGVNAMSFVFAIIALYVNFCPVEPATVIITPDQAMTEANLDGRSITVSLSGINFLDATLDPANFTLNNAPSGCTVESVTYVDPTHCIIDLAFDGTDFDADVTSLGLTIHGAELPQDPPAISYNQLSITATNDAESISIASDGNITEGAESGEIITVTLAGGTFAPVLTAANWTLANLPAGVSKGAVIRVDATHATIALSGNRTVDYDVDITDLTVTCTTAEYRDATGGAALSVSSGVTFTAIVEPVTVTIASDQAMTEANLDARSITVAITEDRFADNSLAAGNFTLINAPTGCTVESVTYTDATHCIINLAFDGTDFDADVTDFGITINGAELAGAAAIGSGNRLSITATNDAESISIASDGNITEGTESGEIITVTLAGGTFAPVLTAANWTLANLPVGVSMGAVTHVDATHATIALSGNRTVDYDADITGLTVTCTTAEYRDATGGASLSASGGVTFTAVVELPAVPAAPTLLYPANGAVSVPVTLTFLWYSVPNAVSYRVQISTQSDFSNIVKDSAGINDTAFTVTGLSNGAEYYWRVNATNQGGTSAWSGTCSLTTIIALPSAVSLLLPENGDTVHLDSVLFLWRKAAPEITGYRLDLATDSQFVNAIVDSAIVDTSKPVSHLTNNTRYWWRVRARNAAGWGGWSTTGKFVVWKPMTAVIPGAYQVTFSGLHTRNGIIQYALPKQSMVSVRVYDVRGRTLFSAVNRIQQPGFYAVALSPALSANGYKILVFKAGDYVMKRKMVIAR